MIFAQTVRNICLLILGLSIDAKYGTVVGFPLALLFVAISMWSQE